jgi:3-phosphoshikimate 1-carboxyvinyltransferase
MLMLAPAGLSATPRWRGVLRCAGDIAIAERALIVASLSNLRSEIVNLPRAGAHLALVTALQALGVVIEIAPAAAGTIQIAVRGAGLHGLAQPKAAIGAGVSALGATLLAAVVSGQPWPANVATEKFGAHYNQMLRTTLGSMGAKLGESADFASHGLGTDEYLHGAQMDVRAGPELGKAAALFAGLFAHGATAMVEGEVTLDHSERMLAHAGAPLRSMGSALALEPSGWGAQLEAVQGAVPADADSVRWIVAFALAAPSAEIEVPGVGLNVGRTAWLRALQAAAAPVRAELNGAFMAEPVGTVYVAHNSPWPAARLAASTRSAGQENPQAGAADAALEALLIQFADQRIGEIRGAAEIAAQYPRLLAQLASLGLPISSV